MYDLNEAYFHNLLIPPIGLTLSHRVHKRLELVMKCQIWVKDVKWRLVDKRKHAIIKVASSIENLFWGIVCQGNFISADHILIKALTVRKGIYGYWTTMTLYRCRMFVNDASRLKNLTKNSLQTHQYSLVFQNHVWLVLYLNHRPLKSYNHG